MPGSGHSTLRSRLHGWLSQRAFAALELHEILQKNPVITVPRLMAKFGITAPTANSALRLLVALGLVREITGQKRHRVFAYQEYLRTLNEGTELPAFRTEIIRPAALIHWYVCAPQAPKFDPVWPPQSLTPSGPPAGASRLARWAESESSRAQSVEEARAKKAQ